MIVAVKIATTINNHLCKNIIDEYQSFIRLREKKFGRKLATANLLVSVEKFMLKAIISVGNDLQMNININFINTKFFTPISMPIMARVRHSIFVGLLTKQECQSKLGTVLIRNNKFLGYYRHQNRCKKISINKINIYLHF